MLTAMCNVMKEAYERGWITTRDGNISVMGENSKFYVTPSGIRKNTIKVEEIVRAKLDNNYKPVLPDDVAPSIEADMHWQIHLNKGFRVGSVVHLHPTHCVAAMYAGYELSKLQKEFPELGRYTKVGENVESFYPGSDELATVTASNIDGFDIVGQKNHGVTAYGLSPWCAFEHIERLEHICEIVLKAGK